MYHPDRDNPVTRNCGEKRLFRLCCRISFAQHGHIVTPSKRLIDSCEENAVRQTENFTNRALLRENVAAISSCARKISLKFLRAFAGRPANLDLATKRVQLIRRAT
jgi:hypothetical protein